MAVLILAIAAALTLPRLRFESSTTAPMIAAPCPAVLAPLDLAFTPLPRIAPERLPKEERHQPARDDLDQIGQAVIDQLEELMENPQVAAEYDTEDSAYDADPLPVDLSNEELERLEQALLVLGGQFQIEGDQVGEEPGLGVIPDENLLGEPIAVYEA